MVKQRLLLDWIALEPSASLPRYRQLYIQLRSAIVSGRLPAGGLLPSSRLLSQELSISRNTVLNAYDQLIADGYIETSDRSETFIADYAAGMRRPSPRSAEAKVDDATPPLSSHGAALHSSFSPELDLPNAVAFTPGVPAFDQFPIKTWVKLLAHQAHRMQPEMAGFDGHIGGYRPLREALTSYLQTSRMVECTPDQILIISSARAGLDLACRVVADPGSACLMEEPGYDTARVIMRAAGLKVVPVPVDSEGMRLGRRERNTGNARIAYVTPSHQWPTGVSLSAPRRQQLLDWAQKRNAWVIEDDYDSEFRFRSRPLATLQGLDGGRRVIYLGTFSKVMFPSLRTAYLVVPRTLLPIFRQALYYSGKEPALHVQAALADFITQGYFASHIRRMRRLYERRQSFFFDALMQQLGTHMPIERPAGGFQIALTLPKEYPAEKASLAAASAGLHARALSIYALTGKAPNALHLGFAAIPERRIVPATKLLAAAILGCASNKLPTLLQ